MTWYRPGMKDEVKISADDAAKLESYEESINQHCRSAVTLEIQRQGLLETVYNLQNGKKIHMADVLKRHEIDPDKVATVHVSGDTLKIVYKPEG